MAVVVSVVLHQGATGPQISGGRRSIRRCRVDENAARLIIVSVVSVDMYSSMWTLVPSFI